MFRLSTWYQPNNPQFKLINLFVSWSSVTANDRLSDYSINAWDGGGTDLPPFRCNFLARLSMWHFSFMMILIEKCCYRRRALAKAGTDERGPPLSFCCELLDLLSPTCGSHRYLHPLEYQQSPPRWNSVFESKSATAIMFLIIYHVI